MVIKRSSKFIIQSFVFVIVSFLAASNLGIAQSKYLVQPNDVLNILVWKEPDLSNEVTVHPDGTFTAPLVGEVQASGRTISDIQADVAKNLNKFIPDPVVTISLEQHVENHVYVIGQVNAPGVFAVDKLPDVMQALSLAGGMTAFASLNKIRILRRNNSGQTAIPFRYSDVAKGQKLEQNIVLKDGDVIVVP